jgi:hypothetical protein
LSFEWLSALTATAAVLLEGLLALTVTAAAGATGSFGSGATVGGATAFGAELLLLLGFATGTAACGAGALTFGAWLVAPLFVLLLSPSPLPPIWWSLVWVGLSWR